MHVIFLSCTFLIEDRIWTTCLWEGLLFVACNAARGRLDSMFLCLSRVVIRVWGCFGIAHIMQPLANALETYMYPCNRTKKCRELFQKYLSAQESVCYVMSWAAEGVV